MNTREDVALIETVHGRFALALRKLAPHGEAPAIEDYLGATPEPTRSALLRWLLQEELEYRRKLGEQPTKAEYLDRFPAEKSAVEEAWRETTVEPTESSQIDLFPVAAIEELAERLPHLEYFELIGRGGMGAVYKARERALDRLVAVKVLPPELAQDPDFRRRFKREAKILARLDHPNIVRIHQYIEQYDEQDPKRSLFCFIMEYLEGGNLRQHMKDPISPNDAIDIMKQVCKGLQAAHGKKVIHRDIKPENILLDRQGRVKIADFGLAKIVDPNRPADLFTGTNQVMGTGDYMAPEQWRGARSIDHRADIYSLGVVFHELLTRKLPEDPLQPPSSIGGPAWLDEVVFRALQPSPTHRFTDVSEIINALDRQVSVGRVSDEYFEILKEGPPPEKMAAFLERHPKQLQAALGGNFEKGHLEFDPGALGGFAPHFERGQLVADSGDFGIVEPDLSVGTETGKYWEWRHFWFCPAGDRLFEGGNPTESLKRAIDHVAKLHEWDDECRRRNRRHRDHHDGIILAGRGQHLSGEQAEGIEHLRKDRIFIYTYDSLFDPGFQSSRRNSRFQGR